jgi:hypothetical protein
LYWYWYWYSTAAVLATTDDMVGMHKMKGKRRGEERREEEKARPGEGL